MWQQIQVLFFATMLTSVSQAGHEICTVDDQKRLIWFSPQTHYPPEKEADFLSLFTEKSGWNNSSSKIAVFKFSSQFFVHIPKDALRPVVEDLNRRNIKIAIEGEASCGKFPGTSDVAEVISKKLRSVGGELAYVAMDEPISRSYLDRSANGCHLDLLGAAKRTAAVMKVYKLHFPNVVIGDIEPFPSIYYDSPNWHDDIEQFYKHFENEAGFPVEFFHVDMNWRDNRILSRDQYNTRAISDMLSEASILSQRLGLRFGVIYNGKANAKTDASWMQDGRYNAKIIEASKTKPHDVIFQTWHSYPKKMLPEDSSSAFLSIVPWFCSGGILQE